MKILCAVTHPDVRRSLTGCVQAGGYEVESVECEADVLECLDATGNYDAILLYLFTGRAGTDLLNLIRANKRLTSLPVIVVCEPIFKEFVLKRNGIFANEEFLVDSVIAALSDIAKSLPQTVTT